MSRRKKIEKEDIPLEVVQEDIYNLISKVGELSYEKIHHLFDDKYTWWQINKSLHNLEDEHKLKRYDKAVMVETYFKVES